MGLIVLSSFHVSERVGAKVGTYVDESVSQMPAFLPEMGTETVRGYSAGKHGSNWRYPQAGGTRPCVMRHHKTAPLRKTLIFSLKVFSHREGG